MTNLRTLRGGSWHYGPWWLRADFRSWGTPSDRYDGLGFRVIEDVKPSNGMVISHGGSRFHDLAFTRPSLRNRFNPANRNLAVGFRVVEEKQHG